MEREPICGICWAHRRKRVPLEYDVHAHCWRCHNCGAVVLDPGDGERTQEHIETLLSLPIDPGAAQEEPPPSYIGTVSRMYEPLSLSYQGTPVRESSGGGGRKRTKPRKRERWYPRTDPPAAKPHP